MQQLQWPAELIDPDEVRTWIAGILPGKPSVEGPVAIEWAKQWGASLPKHQVGPTAIRARPR